MQDKVPGTFEEHLTCEFFPENPSSENPGLSDSSASESDVSIFNDSHEKEVFTNTFKVEENVVFGSPMRTRATYTHETPERKISVRVDTISCSGENTNQNSDIGEEKPQFLDVDQAGISLEMRPLLADQSGTNNAKEPVNSAFVNTVVEGDSLSQSFKFQSGFQHGSANKIHATCRVSSPRKQFLMTLETEFKRHCQNSQEGLGVKENVETDSCPVRDKDLVYTAVENETSKENEQEETFIKLPVVMNESDEKLRESLALEAHVDPVDKTFSIETKTVKCGNIAPTTILNSKVTEGEVPAFVQTEEIFIATGEGKYRSLGVHQRCRTKFPNSSSEESPQGKLMLADILPSIQNSDYEGFIKQVYHDCVSENSGTVTSGALAVQLCSSLANLPSKLLETLREAFCHDGTENILDMSSYQSILTNWILNHFEDGHKIMHVLSDKDQEATADATAESEAIPLTGKVVSFDRSTVVPHDSKTTDNISKPHPILYHPAFPLSKVEDHSGISYENFEEDDTFFIAKTRRKLLYEEGKPDREGPFCSSNRRSTLLPRMKGSRGTGGGEDDEESDPGGDVLDMSRPPSPITPAAGASCFYRNTLSTTFHKSRDEAREAQESPCYNFRIGEVTTASFRTPDPEVLQEDLRELELTRRHLVERNAELNAQIQVCEDANNSLRKHCLDLEGALKGFQHQIKDKDKLEEDIKELHSLLDNEREARQNAEAQIYVLKKEKFSLASKLEDTEIELKYCQEENFRVKQRVGDLVKEKENEAAVFRNLIDQYERQLSEELKTAENLQEENKELHEDLRNLQEELVYFKEKLSAAPPEVNRTVEEDDLQLNTSNRVAKAPWTPDLFTTCDQTTSATETPGSIRSEIEMMSTSDGSIPFCGKSERGISTGSLNCEVIFGSVGKGDASTLSYLTSILNWWKERSSQNDSCPKEFKDEKDSAMYSHFLKHYDELLKLEKGLQNIVKKEVDHSSPLLENTCEKTPPSSRRASRNSTAGTLSPEGNLGNADTLSQSSGLRTPGSLVSNLIYKFERSSLSPSPSYSSESKRIASSKEYESEGEGGSLKSKKSKPSHDYDYLRDSKILSRSELILSESRDDRLDNNSNLISAEEDNENVTDAISENASERLTGSLPQSCNASDVLDSGFEQDTGYGIITMGYQPMYGSRNDVCSKDDDDKWSVEHKVNRVVVLSSGLDCEDSESQEDVFEETTTLKLTQVAQVPTPSSDQDAELDLGVDVEPEPFMEHSQLMKLTNQVQEKDNLLKKVKKQLSEAEDEVEASNVLLIRIFRLASQVFGDVFRWIETVRKEWLSSVPAVREDEGASAPLRTPDPLYDLPLTGSHSREEIESLINTRCDLGCHVSRDDLRKEYVNPENLAIELERELLALKLHVARSHALLHHYQSSSLHGSRSEVSTTPVVASTHHVQGVEAGVEADLCGPTCIPRPCDSTATQTPASPISVSPECEEPSAGEEASVNLSNDGGGEDPLQDDHRPLTPQHRPLYQRMSLSEEEVEEESTCDTEMAVSSDHVIYAPKPTYDQLDQYSVKPKKTDEKCRRTGNIHAQIGGSLGRKGACGVTNSDSEEEKIKEREAVFCAPATGLTRLPFARQMRCHSDPQVAPLSPPPSLDMEDDEEEMTKGLRPEEEEPELPSTPESGPSSASASGDLFLATPAYATFSNIEEEEEEASAKRRRDRPRVSVDPTNPSALPGSHSTPSTPAARSEEDSSERTAPSWDAIFPSLQDSHLKAFGVSVHDPSPLNENLSAQEIENKFKQLSLAFKTDRLTLKQRLDVQHRQRDTAEANFERELDQLRKSILALHEECLDTDLVDAIMEVRKHVDVLTTSSSSLLSASEVWGAVQQEWRVSKALEVLLLHVENVNRLYEHDHQELEEMRRVLQENQIEYPASSGTATSHFSLAGDLEGSNRRGRTYSFHNITKQTSENGNRRISLGPGTSKAVLNQFLNQRASKRRLSLVPDLRSYHQELANAVEKAVAAKAQENNEEKSNNNMMRSSITEEGRESGEETDSAGQDNSNNSPTSATLRSLTQYPLYGQPLEDPSEMSYEDDSTSLINSQVTDTQIANNSPDSLGSQSQNWLLQYCEEIFHYCRTGNWPDTNQQIIRCVFTSFLLLVAVFCLIIAATSADEGLLEPRCPDWTMFIKYNGLPPT
ncbi:LOW QUALITY PROTEIN: uncharacterized protein [Palaemon carinicauda]|uniref:LOW QUALITY PROTEIN: uncharacterized protein n=1 Tax=Palaemon carinicauda TaxID=392227 RepID=UPI0035B67C6D